MFKAETSIFKIALSTAIFPGRVENRQGLGVQSHAKRVAHAEGSHVRTASKIKKPLKGVVEDGLGYNMSKAEASIFKIGGSVSTQTLYSAEIDPKRQARLRRSRKSFFRWDNI